MAVISSNYQQTDNDVNYTLFVNIPLPFLSLNLDLNLVGSFVLPLLDALMIPAGVQYLMTNAAALVDEINKDVLLLIEAIPEATVTVALTVGGAPVFGARFVAQQTPVVIGVPDFQLGLPNFAVGAGFQIPVPNFGVVDIAVPIPVPIVRLPRVAITGGNVSASANVGATSVAAGTYFPTI